VEAHFKGNETGRLQMRERSALRNVKGHCDVNGLAHEDGESQLGSHRGRLETKEYLHEHNGKWGIYDCRLCRPRIYTVDDVTSCGDRLAKRQRFEEISGRFLLEMLAFGKSPTFPIWVDQTPMAVMSTFGSESQVNIRCLFQSVLFIP
jgi:hypothetical protein